MSLYLFVIIVGILFLTGTFVSSSFATINGFSTVDYYSISSNSDKDNDDPVIEQESRLQICCSWSSKLSDGVLKYSIDDAQEDGEQKGRHAIINTPNEVYDIFIKIPFVKCNIIIYPIIEVLPLQILAYYLSLVKNVDPDYPRNLAKSVTVK
jgi:hypothetical protein